MGLVFAFFRKSGTAKRLLFVTCTFFYYVCIFSRLQMVLSSHQEFQKMTHYKSSVLTFAGKRGGEGRRGFQNFPLSSPVFPPPSLPSTSYICSAISCTLVLLSNLGCFLLLISALEPPSGASKEGTKTVHSF